MVPTDHAITYRADEENSPLAASTPGTDPQLLPGGKAHLQWRGRGPEQQGQSHHEKILRISHLPSARTGTLSLTWQAARTRINPRFFLTNPITRAQLRAGQ